MSSSRPAIHSPPKHDSRFKESKLTDESLVRGWDNGLAPRVERSVPVVLGGGEGASRLMEIWCPQTATYGTKIDEFFSSPSAGHAHEPYSASAGEKSLLTILASTWATAFLSHQKDSQPILFPVRKEPLTPKNIFFPKFWGEKMGLKLIPIRMAVGVTRKIDSEAGQKCKTHAVLQLHRKTPMCRIFRGCPNKRDFFVVKFRVRCGPV